MKEQPMTEKRLARLSKIRMNFGQYKDDLTWGELVEEDPEYAKWILKIATYKPMIAFLKHHFPDEPLL